MTVESRYCSWCHLAGGHTVTVANRIRRDIYACNRCKEPTVVCMVPGCTHMAKAGGAWDDKLCAEHDGTVPNLAASKSELENIAQFGRVLQRSSTNFLPNPLFKGSIGRAVSPIKNDHLALEHFTIENLRAGSRHAVIFVNGFLSQGSKDLDDWKSAADKHFGDASLYHLDWESTTHPQKLLADELLKGAVLPFGPAAAPRLALRVLEAAAVWHLSMRNAEIAGRLLADAIVRTPGWRFTLAGHSLGGRVIHFALSELARRKCLRVETAYLLGAAVGGGAKDDDCWDRALTATRLGIVNCYSSQDDVLKRAYRYANVALSKPAGLAGINLKHARLTDVDCTDIVAGHTSWKQHFGEILHRLASR